MRQQPEPPRGEAESSVIRSSQHPLLKRMGRILAGDERAGCVLEGDRLILDAHASRVALDAVLLSAEREGTALEWERLGLPVRRVDGELLERRSGLKRSPGSAALCAPPRAWTVESLPLGSAGAAARFDPLVLVAAGVSDPGNLGSMARSAEAMGASAVVVVAGGASPWNDKALRGSMGSLLRMPVARCATAQEAREALRRRGLRLALAATRGGADAREFDWSGPLALWMGPETGAAQEDAAGLERVTIPMQGAVESLNVSAAAALLLFHARRPGVPRS